MIITISEYSTDGRLILEQQSRALTYEEFCFDMERAALPLIEVEELTKWQAVCAYVLAKPCTLNTELWGDK